MIDMNGKKIKKPTAQHRLSLCDFTYVITRHKTYMTNTTCGSPEWLQQGSHAWYLNNTMLTFIPHQYCQ